MKETRVWETAVLAIVVFLSIGAWVVSGSFPKGDSPLVGPAVFPRVLGVILLVSSIAVFWQSRREALQASREATPSPEPEVPFNWFKLLRPIGVLVLFGFAPLLLANIGLLATVGIITVCVCLLLGAKPLETGIASLGMVGFVYLVFILLLKLQT